MPDDSVADDTGIAINTGHGSKHATVAQLDRALTLAVAMHKRRAPIVVHVPQPRVTQARPREQRPRRRAKATARGDPDEPPLVEIPPAEFRRQLRALGVSP